MPRKLTDEVLARILAVEAARKAIPTRAQLAIELGISKSLVDQTAKKLQLTVPRETSFKMQHDSIELGLAKP